jgi:hypothetical protein
MITRSCDGASGARRHELPEESILVLRPGVEPADSPYAPRRPSALMRNQPFSCFSWTRRVIRRRSFSRRDAAF